MRSITIDILNEKAVNLLKELEVLKLIKITSKTSDPTRSRKKASEFKGSLPADLGHQMQERIKQSREEWTHRI